MDLVKKKINGCNKDKSNYRLVAVKEGKCQYDEITIKYNSSDIFV